VTLEAGPRRWAAPNQSSSKIEKQEWSWVIAVSALIVIASTIPYLAGYLAQTPDEVFGGAVLDKPDYHSHLAKMWQGYRGEWRYRLLFTPEDHEGAYLQTFYVVLGHLARFSGRGLAETYQIARVLLGFILLNVIYVFIARFVLPIRHRRIAYLLATLASGFGWIREIIAPTVAGGVSPMSFWLIDGYTYLSLLAFPHFCLAMIFLLAVFLLLLWEPDGPSLRTGLVAALLSVGLGLVHPHMLLVADVVPALYWAVDGFATRRMLRGWLCIAGIALVQAPILAYDVWTFRTQDVFAAWSAQNVTLSPPVPVYLWGYGLLLGLTIIGLRASRRTSTRDALFLWIWIALVSLLIYVPWNLQRRFLETIQVPLGILAGLGVVELAGKLQARRSRHPAIFWPSDVIAAVDWLSEHSTWNETVLAAPETGSLIPARIGHRVVIGHEMETVAYKTKLQSVTRFYEASTPESVRRNLLRNWDVRYVLHGPHENSLDGFDPDRSENLIPVFRQDNVSVYRVR